MPDPRTICLIASLGLASLGAHATGLQQVLDDPAQSCPPLLHTGYAGNAELLASLYGTSEGRPLWSDPGRLQALRSAFEALADDGLEPAEYLPDPFPAPSLDQPAATAACQDLLLTRGYLDALRHLARGRLAQRDYEPLWREREHTGDEIRATLALAKAGLADPARAFEQARPAAEQYRHLRLAYARARQEPLADWFALASGPLLRPGMSDPRVAGLEARLQMAGYLPPASEPATHHHPALVNALRAFQQDHGLQADGILGPATLHELNISPASRLHGLRANLERWRWLARDLEPDLLLVDIAGAQLALYRDGQAVWQTRAQVGRAGRATPQLKSTITRLTLNPTWTVPPTILREDKLPQIRQDPEYLTRSRLQVLDFQGHPVDPATVDWNAPSGVMLRQEAGPDNPLGQVAVRFANPFAIYLHDTPSQRLFASAERATSSGCVRVEAALGLVEQLLTEAERDTVERRLALGRTYEYRLQRPTPVLLGYWTAEADALGTAHYRPDIYRQDAALIAALNRAMSEGRSIAR
ncbi:L,D-transpeptidase family protein [Stutzerimonas tarimensis]|uniref:Murein L,D-transpeptidase n=1 Tax=Stutzerimonas tarimensis TaxID=1507735 RepID=A0ABV7T565_9GAMM